MTMDNGMDADQGWEDLKAERDVARRDYEVMNRLREGAEEERDVAIWERDEAQKIAHAVLDERDALAAHVERLFVRWNELTEEGVTHVELADAMDAIFGDAPITSLARLKAQWQAAAIEEWSGVIIRSIEYAAAKHDENPNYPPICLHMIRELCCDMEDDADRIRQAADVDAITDIWRHLAQENAK